MGTCNGNGVKHFLLLLHATEIFGKVVQGWIKSLVND
jgi:hypothetical protein